MINTLGWYCWGTTVQVFPVPGKGQVASKGGAVIDDLQLTCNSGDLSRGKGSLLCL